MGQSMGQKPISEGRQMASKIKVIKMDRIPCFLVSRHIGSSTILDYSSTSSYFCEILVVDMLLCALRRFSFVIPQSYFSHVNLCTDAVLL